MSGDGTYRLPPDAHLQEAVTPLAEVYSWGHEFLAIEDNWLKNAGTVNEQPIKCAVLDTGVDPGHPDLQGAVIDLKDFTGSLSGPNDRSGHGTWCVGCIGARANNIGVRGFAYKCQILSGKVLGDNGSGNDRTIGKGLEWAVDQGAKFVSLSLGGRGMSRWLREMFDEFARDHVLIFAAAGNDGKSLNDPASFPSTISVGAIDKRGRMTRFTSRDSRLDILAPGYKLLSLAPGGKYATLTGTSMATPIACGVAMISYGHQKTKADDTKLDDVDEMRSELRRSGTPTRDGYPIINPDGLQGNGTVDGEKPLPVTVTKHPTENRITITW